MVKVLSFSFGQCLASLPCYLSNGPFGTGGDFLETGISRQLSNHDFRSPSGENTSGMRVIFFLKMFKIEFQFTKDKKKLENIFLFPR